MSYSCTYNCFDKNLANIKWQTEDFSNLKNYEDEELMIHDLELGSVCSVSLNGNEHGIIVSVMEAHDIKVVDFPTLGNIKKLLTSLDVSKVRKALLSESGDQYEPEIRDGFDSVLGVVKELVSNADPAETVYSIKGMEKYMTPLFEACGILLYSTVTKKQLTTFNDQFSEEVYETALVGLLDTYERVVNENNKYAQADLISVLAQFKKMVQILDNNSELVFVFSDDERGLPELFQDRLVDIKLKF